MVSTGWPVIIAIMPFVLITLLLALVSDLREGLQILSATDHWVLRIAWVILFLTGGLIIFSLYRNWGNDTWRAGYA